MKNPDITGNLGRNKHPNQPVMLPPLAPGTCTFSKTTLRPNRKLVNKKDLRKNSKTLNVNEQTLNRYSLKENTRLPVYVSIKLY